MTDNIYVPSEFAGRGDASLLFEEHGTQIRRELITHLIGTAPSLRQIPLEDRIRYIDEARQRALLTYVQDASIPYGERMQTDLYAALMDAITPEKIMQALNFSAKNAGISSASSLFAAGSNLAYPSLEMSVDSRNADTLTEWTLRLAAGVPVLVKGGPMSIAFARELGKTPLGDSVAVLDWNSGKPTDEFYGLLPDDAEVIMSGGITGIAAVKQQLNPKINLIRERNHRRSIGLITSDTDYDALARAIGFIDGFGCLTPSILFAENPLEAKEKLYSALVRFSQTYGGFCIPDKVKARIGKELMSHSTEVNFSIKSDVGAIVAYTGADMAAFEQGYRTATIYQMPTAAEGWRNAFAQLNGNLEAHAIRGLGGGGCGGGARDATVTKADEAEIKRYFSGGVPYNWTQTLVASNPSSELIASFVAAGGRRIVTPEYAVPNHCFPVDMEPPIPLKKQGDNIIWDNAPAYFCTLNDGQIIAVNGHMLPQPYQI
ncbi:MAG: hypothetical protein V1859_09715 [archaeon]